MVFLVLLLQMSKRQYPFEAEESRKKKRRTGKRYLSASDVLKNATEEERTIYDQKVMMRNQHKYELLPQFIDDEETQNDISTARILDEVYKNGFKKCVTIDELEDNPKDFPKTILSLDTKIIPNEKHYRYVPTENWKLRRQNLAVLRQFRRLSVRRYEFLSQQNPMSAFNNYPIALKLWKEYMANNERKIDVNDYKTTNVKECKRFLEKAKQEQVTNEVFCALSSLRGTPEMKETTPQDEMLFAKLKGKIRLNISQLLQENLVITEQ